MITVAIVNLKGGSAKTTTTAFMLHVLHEMGLRTLGVDADGENESLADWQAAADWPIPVVGMAVPNLHKQLPGVVGDRYDAVGIDTPPMREQRGTVVSALKLATHVVIPIAPTSMEHKELPKVRAVIEEVNEVRDAPPVVAVLLTRCSPRAASTGVYRNLIAEDGLTVLKAQVNRSERYAQAYGDPIRKALGTPYGDAVDELLDLEVTA
jgi:chromosome partitioning protein